MNLCLGVKGQNLFFGEGLGVAKVKGFGDQVRERLRALGYVKNGKLDINGFSVDHGYIPSYVYRWAKGQVPRGQTLIRLSRDLKASPEDLLGPPPPPPKRTPHPIAGGSDGCGILAGVENLKVVSLVRLWLRTLAEAWARPLLPNVAYA
jgi:hypothetical protein